ncbi:MAG: hypothetical protein JWQ27_711 [Ferruginibacter sp.]|nr:hypothetical protein [Ferruginibacter sp.]
MPKKDIRIDNYILKAQPFAQPILNYLRDLVHSVCPDVEETIKWSFPHFDYKGSFCHMAAFKEHCAFGFWKAALMTDASNLKENQQTAMGHLGRITNMKDLPSAKNLTAMLKEAMRLNDSGVKLPPRQKTPATAVIEVPDYFKKALNKNPAAKERFNAFSASHRKEYVLWITEAKTDATRERRMATALEWIAAGKGRNWKYETPKK